MLAVLLLAGGLWFVGAQLGVDRAKRGIVVGGIFAFVLLIHLVLPDGHPIREATGGTAGVWLLLAAVGLVVIGYRMVLARLRARAGADADVGTDHQPAATGAQARRGGRFSNVELDRYARHIVLREIGGPGQRRLRDARVLVIGAGGLGSPALLYLAAAGVGSLGVVDDDTVEIANLQRQVIHTDARIGEPKVKSAAAALSALNPHVEVRPYQRRLTPEIAADLFADYDLILDGTDNFATRYLANETAVAQRKPLISGALAQWEGQVSVFDPARGGPCYRCIFPEAPAPELAPSCAEAGVLGPLPGVVGAMMAAEAVKVLTGAGAPLRGEMLIYDALWSETRKITLGRRPDCPVCGGLESDARPA